jgi:hypothetical protein
MANDRKITIVRARLVENLFIFEKVMLVSLGRCVELIAFVTVIAYKYYLSKAIDNKYQKI